MPANARVSEPYWHRAGEAGRYTFDEDAPFGLPFRPTPFVAELVLTVGDVPVRMTVPVQYRYEGNIFSGEKRMELTVVPALSVRSTPEIVIVPTAAGPQPTSNSTLAASTREIRVAVTNNAPGAAEADVTLNVPHGWTVTPPSAHVRFERADEASTVRFAVTPSGAVTPGQFELKAVREDGRRDLRSRLPGHRVSAHPAAAHLRHGSHDPQGHRRADPAGTLDRLRHGCGRPGTRRPRAARCHSPRADRRGSRVRRPLEVRRHRHGRAGVRAAA